MFAFLFTSIVDLYIHGSSRLVHTSEPFRKKMCSDAILTHEAELDITDYPNTFRHSTSAQTENKFVETSLVHALSYISCHISAKIGPVAITILADSDYYSQPNNDSNRSESGKNRFIDFGVPLQEAHKTGLGSSAALVTAFTAAVLAHYLPLDYSAWGSEIRKVRIHNLAQAAHCTAQGKIGSGFDIAAAVYGSCIYRRFSPAVLESLGEVGSKGFCGRLKAVVNDPGVPSLWDTQIDNTAVKIPRGLRLVMCDVDCGSETPGMVKRVLAWRKEHEEEATLLWTTLQRGNQDLASELKRLADNESVPSDPATYENLASIILTIRSLIREMSEKTGVPIEPKVQTDLLDSCCRLQGVVGGVVPGAGGFDAISLLVEDRVKTLELLGHHIDRYKVNREEGQGHSIGKVRLLGVKQEMEGTRTEDTNIYGHWVQ